MAKLTDRERGAAVFADPDVAASYHGRQPYPNAMYDRLLAVAGDRRRALDIGTGPGKIARRLADHFTEVVALDPSAAMIAIGQAEDAGVHRNIVWVESRAEDYEPDGDFDLATAGASIHWPDETVLFPRLARWTLTIAIINDAPVFPHPAPPCGMQAWLAVLNRWGVRMGRAPIVAPESEQSWPAGAPPHEAWMQIQGRERFRYSFRQRVEAFIAGNHARVSWHRRAMGEAMASAFDAELDALMRPYAVDGMLEVDAICELTWGRPLPAPKA